MRRRQATLLAALATGATALLTFGVAAPGASASTGHGSRSSVLPYRVSASYHEMYDASTPNGITTEPTI
jgi:hypothetical protein